ncbi:hypothetical protein Q5424_09455 [Conexibacter sp. JD483]|uniref:hypothetical protein n=1 Tax=unclassified Conexibacter TaxID=2627773 RepID=UPI002716F4ED|nr:MULTISPECIES: hypothetical protein [unclassified Conexibacter]MDO8187197.1 hypothetical protein [Conexibacter sp. CPCC 205706]MDO8199294.1 hypothetical protein [Conexibacter sp. CPCC 205762]MDR9369305.1 hypothetical protein [Conexibacter sp. JD483]
MVRTRAGRTLAVAAASTLLLATAPAAMATQSTIRGSISPNKGKPGTALALSVGFTIKRENNENNTLSKVVLSFPRNATVNGAKFPSCKPEQINATRSFSSCPKGSKIGSGSLRADVPAVPVSNVPGIVTLFNGPGGKSITVNIVAHNPVEIFEAFKAPLKKVGGRYGYVLTAPIPTTLQEINDGWFAQVTSFQTKVKATWRNLPYIAAKKCPAGGRAPIAGAFTFSPGGEIPASASTTATSFITCK